MKKEFTVIVWLLIFWAASCVPLRYDGPYKGKIIDEETGAPIEGVVVLGVWSKIAISPGGGVSSYYDAQETLTNNKGEFEIRGLGLKILSNVAPMSVFIFKSGYQYIDGPWESHKYEGGLMKNKATVEGDRVILPVRKLTLAEISKRIVARPPGVPDEKMAVLTREINKEQGEEGLTP